MFNVLDPVEQSGFQLHNDNCDVSWARLVIMTMPLSTQDYKQVLRNQLLGWVDLKPTTRLQVRSKIVIILEECGLSVQKLWSTLYIFFKVSSIGY